MVEFKSIIKNVLNETSCVFLRDQRVLIVVYLWIVYFISEILYVRGLGDDGQRDCL